MTGKTLMFYINSLHKGGAQRVMLQLAGRFAAEGCRVILVTSFIAGDEYPVPVGVERISIEKEQIRQSRIKSNLSRISALRAMVKEHRPDALIAFMAEPNFRAVLAGAGLPCKTIISVRNDPDKEYAGKLFRFVGKYILPFADGCVFQTEDARAWFPRRLQKKSAVIMNQVSQSFFDEPEAMERKDIFTVGRLNPQKNQAMLIKAYAALGDVDDRLIIIGEGELRDEFEALARDLGLEGRLILPGLSSDVAGDIKGAKLFVLPSDYEGMPNALLEAMALGLCCISTDCPCGGPGSVIDSGANGLLIPVGDEKALSKAMRELLDNKDKRELMAKKARESAERFRPEAVFELWKNFVEDVIK